MKKKTKAKNENEIWTSFGTYTVCHLPFIVCRLYRNRRIEFEVKVIWKPTRLLSNKPVYQIWSPMRRRCLLHVYSRNSRNLISFAYDVLWTYQLECLKRFKYWNKKKKRRPNAACHSQIYNLKRDQTWCQSTLNIVQYWVYKRWNIHWFNVLGIEKGISCFQKTPNSVYRPVFRIQLYWWLFICLSTIHYPLAVYVLCVSFCFISVGRCSSYRYHNLWT